MWMPGTASIQLFLYNLGEVLQLSLVWMAFFFFFLRKRRQLVLNQDPQLKVRLSSSSCVQKPGPLYTSASETGYAPNRCIILKHTYQVLHTSHWNNAHLRSHYEMWPKKKQMWATMIPKKMKKSKILPNFCLSSIIRSVEKRGEIRKTKEQKKATEIILFLCDWFYIIKLQYSYIS